MSPGPRLKMKAAPWNTGHYINGVPYIPSSLERSGANPGFGRRLSFVNAVSSRRGPGARWSFCLR
jgi:hypothetical protein